MKKIVLVGVLCFGIFSVVLAQEKSPEAKAKLKTEAMASRLTLTPQQVNALSTLHLKIYAQLANAEKQCADDKECFKKKKKAIKSDRDAAYKKILLPAQLKQWENIKEQEDKEKDASKVPSTPKPSSGAKTPIKK